MADTEKIFDVRREPLEAKFAAGFDIAVATVHLEIFNAGELSNSTIIALAKDMCASCPIHLTNRYSDPVPIIGTYLGIECSGFDEARENGREGSLLLSPSRAASRQSNSRDVGPDTTTGCGLKVSGLVNEYGRLKFPG